MRATRHLDKLLFREEEADENFFPIVRSTSSVSWHEEKESRGKTKNLIRDKTTILLLKVTQSIPANDFQNNDKVSKIRSTDACTEIEERQYPQQRRRQQRGRSCKQSWRLDHYQQRGARVPAAAATAANCRCAAAAAAEDASEDEPWREGGEDEDEDAEAARAARAPRSMADACCCC